MNDVPIAVWLTGAAVGIISFAGLLARTWDEYEDGVTSAEAAGAVVDLALSLGIWTAVAYAVWSSYRWLRRRNEGDS